MDGEIQSKSEPKTEPETAPVKLKYRRKLTPFLCQEMLYEYATDALDPQRRADMDEFLLKDKTSQDALESVRRGLEYAEKLSQARMSPELVEKLGDSENIPSLIRRYMDWDEWPETLRWSITALTISVMIAGIVTIVPWKKLPQIPSKPAPASNTVVLADIPGSTTGAAVATAGPDTEADVSQFANDTETSGDEHEAPGEHDHPQALEADPPPPEKPALAAAPSPTAKPTATPKPVAVAPPAAPAPAAAVAAGTANSNAAAPTSDPDAETASAAPSTKENKPKGFVYRAFMNLSNVEEVTPDVVTQLESLGAQKAGEVGLGWRRGNGSYFHFTLPEANEAQVLEMLRGYGPVRISKDPHPRVMPSGQIRFILWIEPATN